MWHVAKSLRRDDQICRQAVPCGGGKQHMFSMILDISLIGVIVQLMGGGARALWRDEYNTQ